MKLSKMQIEAMEFIGRGGSFETDHKAYSTFCLTLWSLLKRNYIYDLNGKGGLTPDGQRALQCVTNTMPTPSQFPPQCQQAIDPCASDERPTAYDYGFVDGVQYAHTGRLPAKRLRYCDLKPGQWFRSCRSGDDTEPLMMTTEKSGWHESMCVSLSGKTRYYHRLTYVELVKPKLSFE